MAIMRMSGYVESVDTRSGVKNDKPWKIESALVRVNEFIGTEVTLSRSLEGKITEGEYVDLIVDVSTSGGYLRLSATAHWPAAYAVAEDGLHAVSHTA